MRRDSARGRRAQNSRPLDLPFDNPDVRVYIDNLFLEGMLEPVTCKSSPKGWAAVGVRRDPEQERRSRLASLLDLAKRELPGTDSRHADGYRSRGLGPRSTSY